MVIKNSKGEFPMVIIDLSCAGYMIKIYGEQISVMGLQKEDTKYILSIHLSWFPLPHLVYSQLKIVFSNNGVSLAFESA